jgi:hypothetical protein
MEIIYQRIFSTDLQYIKSTNVVADALSRLKMEDTPFEDNQESFLSLIECFAKKADTDEFHPLNYQQLKIAQDKDKTIQKILKMPNTICSQGLTWGRKSYQTSLLQQEDCNTRTVTKTKIPKLPN